MFYVSVVPRRDDQDNISGVIGLAWDVSPNNEMLKSLEKIISLSSNRDDEVSQEIKKEATKALTSSRLYNLKS